jgi:hypothetical protein
MFGICKIVKWGVLAVGGLAIAGAVVLGTDACSYLRSSARSIRASVKENIPLDFELRRARDLLDEVLPEMQANVRVIAQQEVEIAAAKDEIAIAQRAVDEERTRVAKLRDCLGTAQTSFTFSGASYSREELKTELSRRFDRFKEAEMTLSGKRRLLENRQKSLIAAERQLEQTRARKAALETQVETLAAQYRLVQAAGAGKELRIDENKLAKAERLITEIRKQLDVAERVMAREAKFVSPIPIDVVNEKELMTAVDEHLGAPSAKKTVDAPDHGRDNGSSSGTQALTKASSRQ